MKVYLVIKLIERGFATESIPFKVYSSKKCAEVVAKSVYGVVKELDFVEGEDFDL